MIMTKITHIAMRNKVRRYQIGPESCLVGPTVAKEKRRASGFSWGGVVGICEAARDCNDLLTQSVHADGDARYECSMLQLTEH